MVVSTDAYASDVGVRILEAGGNAVDAAIATALALAVVNPEAGNIGGGGFMLLRLADGRTAALDYREKAPLAASRDMYLDENGELTETSVLGHLAAGVPGTIAGLWEAHQRYGSLAWRELVEPAIRLADGFEVRERQARSLQKSEADLRIYQSTEEIFLPNERPPRVGETFVQADLAATLRRIQELGRDGFYRGITADLIVQEMEHGGGLITHEDLAGYQAEWREPIRFEYRDHAVISMPPVSSGGATLAEIANILEGYDLAALGWHSAETLHLFAEAWKRAYADRNAYLADPDFVTMPLARMISDEYAAERRSEIVLNRATPSLDIGPGLGTPEREQNTTHLSIVDAEGNAVAVTTTINAFYGCKVTVSGAGFLLNDEMDDFAARPGSPNQFGLVQGENNAIEPGKRMLSAMTPTIVLAPDGRLLLVIGSPGGATIITNVFQNISNVIDFGMGIQAAVNAPRLHHQHLPDRIQYEPGSLSPETIASLEAMGHTMRERFDADALYPYIGDVQAIMVLPDGTLEGASDLRRGGAAKGY
ncbi:MAG: gamma-glutamyltransferase [Gemmatimonadales bacterium]|nr:gamma-glutamyltransferase [Gemmatimonadales bacterium]